MILDTNVVYKMPSFLKVMGPDFKGDINYETDSRIDLSNKAFVALKGEKFDGFDFIEAALMNNARLVVCSCEEGHPTRRDEILKLSTKYNKATFIVVSETTLFLQEMARNKISEWRTATKENRVIGIAGSNGKTTTKEMIAFLLSARYPGVVYATPGNLNNHLGVPHTILGMHKNTRFLVLEMGSNHPGELNFLCDICTPDCGTITNIGLEHMEFFPTEEDVFNEESTIFHRCMSLTGNEGLFVLNGQDQYLSRLPRCANTHFLGRDIYLQTTVNSAEIKVNDRKYFIQNKNLIGAHNFYNLAAAFFLCQSISPNSAEEMFKACESFMPKTNRSSWFIRDNKSYYLDAYNANPSSMKAALTGFIDYLGNQKIELSMATFIIGDMNELGENAKKYHQEIGEFLNQHNVISPIFIGRFAEEYRAGFKKRAFCFKSIAEFREKMWANVSKSTDYFFLKASRSLQLESLLDITH